MNITQYFFANIWIIIALFAAFFIPICWYYYFLKKGFSLKKPFEVILNDLATPAIFFSIYSLYLIISTTPGYPVWFYYIVPILALLLLITGFFTGWKNTTTHPLHIINIQEAIFQAPGNRLFYYTFQGYFIAEIFWLQILPLAQHLYFSKSTNTLFFITINNLLGFIIIISLLFITGMFWARFFYAYKLYQQAKKQS